MERKTPILVHSDLSVADHKLRDGCRVILFSMRNISKREIVFESIDGTKFCDRVYDDDQSLSATIFFYGRYRCLKIIMHDYWAALIAKVFGKIGFVNEPTMYYRQHGNNSVWCEKMQRNPVFFCIIVSKKERTAIVV